MKIITKIIEDAYLKGGNDAQNHGLWKITSGDQATKYATEVVNKNDLLPDVSKSVCLLTDTTCGYRTWNGLCNCEDDKCRQKQTVC